ncbi:two-component regulator propeller domain-containing protein [Marinoscillum sp. MHG1-6]|uniref:two-component regulator propeller domain-containing protein n=1 Tax=Marinoscillum sp. MHG1-6 TaxID=2959627 RepID=UPI0021578BEA|nr:two-component regulator propeller domain-containing protein [Marinoscillum sp. MHG1-6]
MNKNLTPVTALRICFMLLLLLSTQLFGQGVNWQYYEIKNLLSEDLIKGVYRDESGYLWLATDAGVLRYDGEETRNFYEGLPSLYTKDIIKSSSGKYYVAHDNGVKTISQKSDSVFLKPIILNGKELPDTLDVVRSIYEDAKGSLWIGEPNSIFRINEEGVKRFYLDSALHSTSYFRSYQFAEDAFGTLWATCHTGDLIVFDSRKEKWQQVVLDIPVDGFCDLASIHGDWLVIGGYEGAAAIKVDSDHRVLDKVYDLTIPNISALEVINDHTLFAGTWNDGLFIMDFDGHQVKSEPIKGVRIKDIVNLHYDQKREEIWINGNEQLGLIKHSPIVDVIKPGWRIEDVSVDGGAIYYSVGSRIYKRDKAYQGVSELVLENSNAYFDRISADDELLWIGDYRNGIYGYNMEEDRISQILSSDKEEHTQFIFCDHNGTRWFTGNRNGLGRLDSTGGFSFNTNVHATTVLRESSAGDLYCVNDWYFSEGEKRTFLGRLNRSTKEFDPVFVEMESGIPANVVIFDMQIDGDGNLWFGTKSGLLLLKKNDQGFDPLITVPVPGMKTAGSVWALEIVGDRLIIASATGLIIMKDGQSLVLDSDFKIPSSRFKDRGLKRYGVNMVLAATVKGLVVVDIDQIQFDKSYPPIIYWVAVNDKKINHDDNLSFEFEYNSSLEVEFMSPSFPESGTKYQTRIEGLSDGWSVPSKARKLSLYGFDEGNYEIQVRAKEKGRTWSEPVTFSFSIAKPWYQGWWFLIAVVVVALGLVWAVLKVYAFRMIRQKQYLESIIKRRTNEIQAQKQQIIDQQQHLIDQKNEIIEQKEELIAKNEAIYKSKESLKEADLNYLRLKEKQLQEQIDYKNKQITTHALNIIQKNETLSALKNKLDNMAKSNAAFKPEAKKISRLINESFKMDKDWEQFKMYFEQVYTGFYSKLKFNYPDLTSQELRLCALIRLNLSNSECASVMGISSDSIKVSRSRLRKKMKLESNTSLTDFIISL